MSIEDYKIEYPFLDILITLSQEKDKIKMLKIIEELINNEKQPLPYLTIHDKSVFDDDRIFQKMIQKEFIYCLIQKGKKLIVDNPINKLRAFLAKIIKLVYSQLQSKEFKSHFKIIIISMINSLTWSTFKEESIQIQFLIKNIKNIMMSNEQCETIILEHSQVSSIILILGFNYYR